MNTPNYQHGDLIRIKSDNQIAIVDYYARYQGLVYVFDALAAYDSVAFFTDEVEPMEKNKS